MALDLAMAAMDYNYAMRAAERIASALEAQGSWPAATGCAAARAIPTMRRHSASKTGTAG
jgi:hypothetical protein